MWNIIFLISCLIFDLLLIVVYNLKKHIKSEENKIFNTLSIITLVSVATEITLQTLTNTIGMNNTLTIVFQKLYLISVSCWFTAFSIYVFYILINKFHNNEYNLKFLKTAHMAVFILLGVLYLILEIHPYKNGEIMYTYGPAVNLLKITLGSYLGLWVILSLCNIKKILKKSYIPIFATFVLMIANLILQSINPSLLLVSLTLTLVIYLMLFTIENPDLKLVNELYKNKQIMEDSYVDKSNFLFAITGEVRTPIIDIKNIYKDVKDSKDVKVLASALEKINNNARRLDYIVNDVLNVNNLEAQNIKFIENKYNFELIFKEVIASVKDLVNPKVKFKYTIEKNIPMLYGDSIKVKQVLTSLLTSSINRTEVGSIEFRVDTISRYDALRLIIQIKDTSKSMDISEVNDIINTTTELNTKEIELLEHNEVNIELCQKIIKLMDGNLMIKSAEGKGTEIILTLDQKIDNNNLERNIYEKYIDTNKKVAIVNQDKHLNEYLRKFFNNNDIKNSIILNGNYLLDDLKKGKNFDYIIIANEMTEINGYTLYQKLKEIEGFDTPVILIIENESLKKHFAKEGFDDIIVKDGIEDKLNELIKKY